MSRLKPPSRTGIFEDLGSSFKPQKPYPKGKKTDSPRKRRSPSLSDFGSDDDGIDELDCLSQQSTRADAGRKEQSNSQTHQLHSYHPDVLTSRSNALKGLKFNKKSNSTKGAKKNSSPNRSKPQPKVKERRYWSDRETESEDEVYEPARKEKGNPMASSTSTISRPKPRSQPRPIPHPIPLPDDPLESLFGTPKAPSRIAPLSTIPLPSPLSYQKTSTGPLEFNESSPTANTSSSSSGSKSAAPSSHPPPPSSSSYCSTRAFLSSSKSAPRLPQSFPGVSPLNSPIRKRSTVAVAQNFPAFSYLDESTKNVALAKTFKKKDKRKRKASDRILQPFPMSTQDFGDVPTSSDDDFNANENHARKRRYEERMGEFSDMDLYEEDSLFMSPAVDPKTLCPYCDEPLPITPTSHLHRLLQTIYQKSHSDPRSTNPLGRKAPLSIFAGVCQRHRFESEILPEAEAKGWPKIIDWERLVTRVKNLRKGLREIIDDSGPKNVDVQVLEGGKGGGEGGMFMLTNFIGKGPRLQCVFWREAMKAVLVRGTRALNGVRAQFLDFDRSQPGYYGGLGSMIIHQTLLDMFPLDSFDPQKITPFSANDFIQRILIPEVALQLIMEDRGLKGFVGAETAFQVLRDSTAYGAAMFPEDSGEVAAAKKINYDEDDDGGIFDVGIGDKIVMERARKRRKEIEDEVKGHMESAMANEKEERKRKRRGLDPTLIGTASEVDEQTLRTSPRRKAAGSQKMKTGIGTDSDVMSGEGGTVSGMKTDGSLPRSRPKRNNKHVNYTDYSSDDGDDVQLEKRGRKKKPKSRQSQSSQSKSRILRSPSASNWPTSRKATETEARFHSKDLSLSKIELCFSDEEEKRNSRIMSRALAESPPKKKSGRKTYMVKDGEQDEIVNLDMDTDVNTPMPKRRAMGNGAGNEDVDITPRPGLKPEAASWPSELGLTAHDSVLARARARAQRNNGHDQPKKNMASSSKTKRNSKKAEWVSHMRSEPLLDGSSDGGLSLNSGCSSGSDDDEMFRTKGKRKGKNKRKKTEEYRWLLSDPSSQEK